MLLDALRVYLKENEKTNQLKLKLVNWFYRYDEDDKECQRMRGKMHVNCLWLILLDFLRNGGYAMLL